MKSDFVITDLVMPDSVDSDDAIDFIQMVEVRNAVAVEQQGPDATVTPEETLPRARRSPSGERFWALAKCDGRVVGRAYCIIPFEEEAPEVEIIIDVLPDYRRRGIGSALLEWARLIIRDHGKAVAQSLIYMFPREGAATISPSSGFGAVPIDEPGSAFALHHGAILGQVGRLSGLALPAVEDVIRPLYDDALKASGDSYSTILWTGLTPAEWLDGIALLHSRMSTDAPSGDLSVTEDRWDAERVRVVDSGWLDSGWQIFTAGSVHIATGQLVAFTQIVTVREEDQPVNQLDTLVLTEHRGHRLGTLVKIANLHALQDARPSCPKIITGNAEENVPMLRVNEAMGFRAEGLGATWRLEV